MAVWEELRAVLARLVDERPGELATASFDPRLGYAVPPGEWGLRAVLVLGPDPENAPRRRTPVLPLTITA